jgi:hypothetical protein
VNQSFTRYRDTTQTDGPAFTLRRQTCVALPTVRRPTPPIVYEVDPRHEHERRQLCAQCQRRASPACGAIGPRMGAGEDAIARDVLSRCSRDTTPRAIEQIRGSNRWRRCVRNRRVSMAGKALHAGTAGPGAPWRFTRRATARADAAHGLAGAFSPCEALLDHSHHGAGELRCGVAVRGSPLATSHRTAQGRRRGGAPSVRIATAVASCWGSIRGHGPHTYPTHARLRPPPATHAV